MKFLSLVSLALVSLVSQFAQASDARISESTLDAQIGLKSVVLDESTVVKSELVLNAVKSANSFTLEADFFMASNSCMAEGVVADFVVEMKGSEAHIFPVTYVKSDAVQPQMCFMIYMPVIEKYSEVIEIPASATKVVLHRVNSEENVLEIF